jgi:hypothetical protein
MATEISTLLELLRRSSISSCIYRTHFGCLLLNQCKCDRINQNDKREDISDMVLDKLLTKSEVAQNARIQVQMPNGDLHDITEIKLMENMLIGPFETHRLSSCD